MSYNTSWEILTLIARLKRRKGKWGAFAKILLFDDDSGVTDALGTLETLVAEVVNVQVTVIGKDLSKAAKDIRGLRENTERLLANDIHTVHSLNRIEQYHVTKSDDDNIRTWLQLEDTTLHQSRHLRYCAERARDTGSCLLKENHEFQEWVNGPNTHPVFLITGRAGRGKTFVASSVVDYVRKIIMSDTSQRRVLADHYAPDECSDKSGPSQLFGALQSIVWQLAKSDNSYYDLLVQEREGSVPSKTPSTSGILSWQASSRRKT